MSPHDPYAPPDAHVSDPVGEPGELAGRGVRLGATLIDVLLLASVTVPAQWFSGYLPRSIDAAMAGQALPRSAILPWFALGVALYVAMQIWPLHRSGQTWGKRLLSIRIVDLSGEKPPLWRLLILRYLIFKAFAAIPAVGALLNLLDVLLIFRQDRRCLHDLIAGTRVVVAR